MAGPPGSLLRPRSGCPDAAIPPAVRRTRHEPPRTCSAASSSPWPSSGSGTPCPRSSAGRSSWPRHLVGDRWAGMARAGGQVIGGAPAPPWDCGSDRLGWLGPARTTSEARGRGARRWQRHRGMATRDAPVTTAGASTASAGPERPASASSSAGRWRFSGAPRARRSGSGRSPTSFRGTPIRPWPRSSTGSPGRGRSASSQTGSSTVTPRRRPWPPTPPGRCVRRSTRPRSGRGPRGVRRRLA